jgi:hypothetical protein
MKKPNKVTVRVQPQLQITDQSHLVDKVIDWKKEYDELYGRTSELLVQAGNFGMRPDEIRMKWQAMQSDIATDEQP